MAALALPVASSSFGDTQAVSNTRLTAENGAKPLNNFVFELLSVENPQGEYSIRNPRDSWVYVSVSSNLTAKPVVTIDSETYPLKRVGGGFETMRYLSEGTHKLSIGGVDSFRRLNVRSIGELSYCEYGSDPYVKETGLYSWKWLRKNVLDNYNVVMGLSDWKKQEKEIESWSSEGKWWMTMEQVPTDFKSADDAYNYFSTRPGMTHPLMKGIWGDEFGEGEQTDLICNALNRIAREPKFKDRQFVAYLSWGFVNQLNERMKKADGKYKDPLVKAIMDNGYRMGHEWYLFDRPTEAEVRKVQFLPDIERRNSRNFEATYPQSASDRIFIMGINMQPEASANQYPNVDFNVFLDMQFQFLATDPAFFGIRGLQGYYSPYASEETTRVYAQLIRHYAIEGHTDRLFKTPYLLDHLKNPDFMEGSAGWTLNPAESGSIETKTASKFGWLQGRQEGDIGIGDSVLWTKRSSSHPNTFSQKIRNLKPGKLYSLRFITGDYQDLVQEKSRAYKHGLSVKISDVKMLPAKTFDAITQNSWGRPYKSFDRAHRYYQSYHQRIFRAKSTTADLTFSDWTEDGKPAGPAGEELIWNFIQVKPYIPE